MAPNFPTGLLQGPDIWFLNQDDFHHFVFHPHLRSQIISHDSILSKKNLMHKPHQQVNHLWQGRLGIDSSQRPGFKSQHSHYLAVCSGTSHLASLSFNFLISEERGMVILAQPTSQSRKKWDHECGNTLQTTKNYIFWLSCQVLLSCQLLMQSSIKYQRLEE